VSLIEQAAKRLEELKRSGVDLPGVLSEVQPDVGGPGAGRPGADRAPALVHPQKHDDSRPAEPRRISRAARIDLARLAADGYVTPDAPRSAIASEFRVIKRPLLANAQAKSGAGSKNTNLIMVTSSVAGEGKSFTALNLALSIAMEQDVRVLLVDADVANPSLLQMLSLPAGPGLLDVLTDERLDLGRVLLRTNVDKLSLLPAGTAHSRATELLASDAMTRLVEEMATRYPDRIILFDSPPLLLTTESQVLAAHMGQIVVVVEAERTTAATLKDALTKVESCPIVLTLLNKARTPEMGSYYGYGYGYQYPPEAKDPTR
jgi:receptor protein-tyrosine kinase